MIATVDGQSNKHSVVYTLNETAAALWEQVKNREFDTPELVQWMCNEYDIDETTALKDIQHTLEEWKNFGLLEE